MGYYFARPESRLDFAMKLLANENIPLATIHYLRRIGLDIASISEDASGIQDRVVLNIAHEQERTILTFDRDYGELIFKHHLKPKASVIYLRLDEYSPQEPGIIIEKLIRENQIDFSNTLTVVDKNGLRQRKYWHFSDSPVGWRKTLFLGFGFIHTQLY